MAALGLAQRAAALVGTKSSYLCSSTRAYSTAVVSKPPAWVFLGPPGVGKGTYAVRASDAFGLAHVAAGDLVREEIKSKSQLGREMAQIVNRGDLLPDEIILKVFQEKFQRELAKGTKQFLLDGFPRTAHQASALDEIADVQLALNLSLREEVLVEKCMGRRICGHCGKNYNIANIYLAANDDQPEIIMPPLDAPPECAPFLEQRSDDNEVTIRRRLEVYNAQASPVEEYYRSRGLLVNFEITGGIPETLPILKTVLEPYVAVASR